MLTKALVTGANAGIGKECARQLSLLKGMEKVYLGYRNPAKAEEAKAELEKLTGKRGVFEVLIVDVSDIASVKEAAGKLPESIDGLVLNAGGQGGHDFASLTEKGATKIMAANVLGHVVLVDSLLDQKKLSGTVLFAGTEAARGVPPTLPRPDVKSGSVENFVSICDGSFTKKKTFETMHGPVKLLGALWISSMARKHPEMRFITMSPGGTSGTNVSNDMAWLMKLMMKMAPLLGMAHGVDTAAKRYVDALTNEDLYKTGVFYASKKGTKGPVCDQAEIFSALKNEEHQDNASAAIYKFL